MATSLSPLNHWFSHVENRIYRARKMFVCLSGVLEWPTLCTNTTVRMCAFYCFNKRVVTGNGMLHTTEAYLVVLLNVYVIF